MKRIALTAALIFAGSVFYVSCKKDDVADTDTVSATDNNLCEGEFMRVLPTVNKIAIDEPGVQRNDPYGNPNIQSCPLISIDTANSFPVVMTVDYGASCTDPVDGKVRSGRMFIEYSLPWDSVGCVMTITLDSFYVGAIHYEGTVVVTRNANNSFRYVLNNGRCTKGGSAPWEILWATDKTITWTSGSQSSQANQVVTITGSNSGTDRNGNTFTATITNALVRDLSCSWITQGTVELVPSGKPTRTVDFGNGSCDNRGTIMIEGNTFEFTMQ